MRERSAIVLAFIVCLVCLCERRADAAERVGVVILSLSKCCTGEAWPRAEEQVRKEFSILDIPVAVEAADTAAEPAASAALSRIAESMGADAGVSVYIIPGEQLRAGVRIYDRVTDKYVVKTWPITAVDDEDDAMYAGLRVVDTLRASLLESRMEKQVADPKRRPVEVGKLAETTTLKTERLKQFSLGMGGALGGSPKKSLLLGGMDAALGWYPLKHLGLQVTVTYLPFGKQVSTGSIVSEVDLLSVRGWVRFRVVEARVYPELYAGGGSVILFGKGVKGEAYRLKYDVSEVGYGGVGGAVNVAITPAIRVSLGFTVGMSFPEVRLYHDDVLAVRLGRPLMEGGLMLMYFPAAKAF